jgi:hypothetical protein
MNHLTEEEITMAYYEELAPEMRCYIDRCSICSSSLARLRNVLDSVREYGVPERGESYGGEVWERLAPALPVRDAAVHRFNSPRLWLRWAIAGPVLAALVAVAFFAGMLTQRNGAGLPGISPKSSERVLLIALGDHLDRSQIVLAELANAAPGTLDMHEERAAARDLLNENRLFRQTAAGAGDSSQGALLDELERVLLDVANGPSTLSPGDLEALRQRLDRSGLLFKVRVVSSNVLEKGQKL